MKQRLEGLGWLHFLRARGSTTKAVAPALRKLLASKNAGVRLGGAMALWHIDAHKNEALKTAIPVPQEEVSTGQRQVSEGDAEALPVLIQAPQDKDRWGCMEAVVWAWKKINPQAAVRAGVC